MKKVLIASTILLAMTTSAFARPGYGHAPTGEVIEIEPVYDQVAVQVPRHQCHTVRIPVYGNSYGYSSGGRLENVIGGMIIGGVLGRAATRDADGARAGAVIGGLLGTTAGGYHDRDVAGYRQDHRCSEYYSTEYQTQFVGNRVTVLDRHGNIHTTFTRQNVTLGQRIQF